MLETLAAMDVADVRTTIRFFAGLGAVCAMLWVTYGFRHNIGLRQMMTGWTCYRDAMREQIRETGWWPLALVRAHFRTLWAFGLSATPSECLRISVSVFHIKSIVRIGWWDVWRPFAGFMGWGPLTQGVTLFTANMIFIGLAYIASTWALMALFRSIPEEDRAEYNILTAPLYPWAKFQRAAALRRASAAVDDQVAAERHRAANLHAELRALARAVDRADDDKARVMAERILARD